MTSEPYQPAGYCPHCGYAIDPGTCPECGKTWSATQLHRVPYWVTRKRIIKRATIFTVTLAVLIGGWYFCFRVKWEAWLPTSTVLRLQGYGPRRLEGELWGRLRSGTLSLAEQQQMFANYLAETDLLQIREPCPAGVKVFINRPEMPNSLRLMDAYCQQLIVDGQPVDPTTKRMGHWWLTLEGWVIGPFAPGQHEVTQVLAIAQFQELGALNPSPGCVPYATFTNSQTFLVENKSVTEYSRPVWSPELAQEISQKAKAYVWHYRSLGHKVEIILQLESPPVSVAGRLWCDFGDGRMPVPGGVAWRGGGGVVGWWRLSYLNKTRSLPFPEGVPSPRLVDVYLVPDPEIAFNSGLTEYFNGVIVWSECRVEEPLEPDYYSRTQVQLKYNSAHHANRLGEVQLPATRPWWDQKRMREKTAEVGLLE